MCFRLEIAFCNLQIWGGKSWDFVLFVFATISVCNQNFYYLKISTLDFLIGKAKENSCV